MPRHPDESDLSFDPHTFVRPILSPWTGEIFDPVGHYITSGESIQKTRQLRIDILHFILSNPPDEQLHADGREALAGADRLLAFLIKARGEYIFLECHRENGLVVCRGTDPRTRPAVKKYAVRYSRPKVHSA